MVGARDRLCITLALCISVPLAVGGCDRDDGATEVTTAAGREQAEDLIRAYARRSGAGDVRLDARGEAAAGGAGFRHDPDRDTLLVRVYVNGVLLEDAPPQELANYRRMVTVLNDPAVGGMFERAGGRFMLDEGREAYFLVREFALASTSAEQLYAAVESMKDVSAVWTTTWLGHVAMMMHGREPPPTQPVTRANNPYKR